MLFGVFLYERFGREFIGELVRSEKRGVESVEEVSGQQFEDVLLDWAISNYLDEPEAGYGYELIDPPDFRLADEVRSGESITGGVNATGVDYIGIEWEDGDALMVDGDVLTALILEDGVVKNPAYPFSLPAGGGSGVLVITSMDDVEYMVEVGSFAGKAGEKGE